MDTCYALPLLDGMLASRGDLAGGPKEIGRRSDAACEYPKPEIIIRSTLMNFPNQLGSAVSATDAKEALLGKRRR